MYALFEDSGKLSSGRMVSDAPASSLIELASGKRLKVKAVQILMRFDRPTPEDLMREASALSQRIDMDLAWEFAPEDEFSFVDLSHLYFSEQASLAEQAACLLKLTEAPHYFRRAGKGRFKKASADILAQALAAIEKKKQIGRAHV